MKIRRFRKEDKGNITKLFYEFLGYRRKLYEKKALAFDDLDDSKKEIYAKNVVSSFISSKDSMLFTAEHEGKLIGFIFGSVEKHPARKLSKAGHLRNFFVTKECRHLGAGKLLFAALSRWFRSKGCSYITVDVFAGNKATLKIYERWGFVQTKIKMKKKI